ncbi:polysaccharide pyruvyl transferase family protein [Segatella bryantii]|uniref:polysaccharide pyruvyl transferase family protein n=1 Tax=Segatella bryantii TaxID=77095 RepID=UPI002479DB3E|nr:polysaccharide pyruvyl transferase family protein [Segatella bryantii]
MANKKVALVTCYYQPNFGSQLQAFATQLALDKLGVENETINIDGLKQEIKKAKLRYFFSRIFDVNTVKDKMATVRKFVASKRNPVYSKNLAVRYDMFKDFSSTMFHLSRRYVSKADVTVAAYDYSAFLVGSDQLWLPSNIAGDYYTLNMVPDAVPKIALATSFGISELPWKYGLKAQKFLTRIDHVSVREITGQKLVKKWAGRDVPVVCDPTVMFTADEWSEALNAKDDGKRYAKGQEYIFVYFLGNNPWERNIVKKVQRQLNIKIVQLAHLDEYVKRDVGFADFMPYDVGPKEFVELVRDAKYVFTDSFHCSVFSMLNHKRFFTFPRYSQDGTVSTNGRLYSLLSLVHQENRLVKKEDAASWDTNMRLASTPNFQTIENELGRLRRFTWDWLINALKESKVL